MYVSFTIPFFFLFVYLIILSFTLPLPLFSPLCYHVLSFVVFFLILRNCLSTIYFFLSHLLCPHSKFNIYALQKKRKRDNNALFIRENKKACEKKRILPNNCVDSNVPCRHLLCGSLPTFSKRKSLISLLFSKCLLFSF